MVSYTNAYESVGNYNVLGSELIDDTVANGGGFLAAQSATTIDDCQSACSKYNSSAASATDRCAGVIFYTPPPTTANTSPPPPTIQRCKLQNSTVLTQPRILNTNYEYYIRKQTISGADTSCPTVMESIDNAAWNTFMLARSALPVPPADMTDTTKCGMANFVNASANAVEAKKTTLSGITNDWNTAINSLKAKYDAMLSNLTSTTTSLATEFSNFMNDNQNMDLTGDQLKQLQAMTEDQDLQMMTKNYKHILWSILAIIIIIATIKLAKTFIANSGASVPALVLPGSA